MQKQISASWEDRLPLWVAVSHKFGSPDDPFTSLEIQDLGHAERLLLGLERQAVDVIAQQRATNELGPQPYALTDLVLHSRFWIFGLYEALRTFRQRVGPNAPEFVKVADVFRRLELARMPLAKHEAKGIKTGLSYPDTLFRSDVGWIGWKVSDPKTRTIVEVWRTELANHFLAAML